MAEHEMTTRARTANKIKVDFIHRDFEVNDMAQIYTAIRELNVMRWWHTKCKQLEYRSRAWLLEGIAGGW